MRNMTTDMKQAARSVTCHAVASGVTRAFAA